MALIPPFFLGTVVALGMPSRDGTIQYNATGFLYGYPTGATNDEGQKIYRIFLVTNRHVFQQAVDRKVQLHARFNTLMESGTNTYTYPIDPQDQFWTVHPDPEADVAVLSVNADRLIQDGIEYRFFQDDDHTFTFDQARDGQVSEGDGVFVLGFPLGLAGEERNYVIVRQGILARVQHWLRGNARTFLIDASIFPGNSGGPVLLKPESTAIQGTKSNNQCSLIGMVSSYLTYQETAVSAQTGRPRMIFEENSGLAVVVPHDVILEVVKSAIHQTE
jgi:hypothetical protein